MKAKEEDKLCKLFFENLQFLAVQKKINLFHIAHINNGEHSGSKLQRILAGKRAKEMGQLKGFLDYIAFRPDGKPIFLEFKFADRKLTPEQKIFIEEQEKLGNETGIFRAKTILDFNSAVNEALQFLHKHKITTF